MQRYGLGTDSGGKPLGGITQSAVAVLIDGVYQNRGEVVRGGTLDMAQAEVIAPRLAVRPWLVPSAWCRTIRSLNTKGPAPSGSAIIIS
jgi:hypothetical protein